MEVLYIIHEKKHYNDNYNMDNDFKKLSSTSSLND